MSIEQTSQLILLILNSALMALLSSILLGGAWLRQNSLLQQLGKTRSHYRKLTRSSVTTSTATALKQPTEQVIVTSTHPAELKKVRDYRQQLSWQYQWSHVGMLVLHLTLLTFSLSLFALALRSLLAFDPLISAALFLFTVGAAGLLTGTGCILVDFARGNSSSDSLGQTLAQVIQQVTRQWKRQGLRLGTAKAFAKEPRS